MTITGPPPDPPGSRARRVAQDRSEALEKARQRLLSDAGARRQAVIAARTVRDDLAPHARAGELATLGEVTGRRVDIATTFAGLIAVAAERAQLYGAQLAAAYAQDPETALLQTKWIVDPESGELIDNGQQETGLVRLERKEREILERLIVNGARLGMEERKAAETARAARVLSEGMRRFAEDLGLDWADPEVRRKAQAALLHGREAAGLDERGGLARQ